ncbi:hypothetical protein [Micromonospora ureilytica]|nr:hypothetical protein [Micromonospora ureilytica]
MRTTGLLGDTSPNAVGVSQARRDLRAATADGRPSPGAVEPTGAPAW